MLIWSSLILPKPLAFFPFLTLPNFADICSWEKGIIKVKDFFQNVFLIALITEKREFAEVLRMFPRTQIYAHKVWFNSSLLFTILLHYYILIFYYIPRKDLIPRSWRNNSLSTCSINPIGSIKSLRPQCMGQHPSFVCGCVYTLY